MLALSFVTPVRAVLFEDFDDDTTTGFLKLEDDDTAAAFHVSGNGDSYWGINDPTGSTDDFDEGASVPDGIPSYTFPVGSGNYFVGEDINEPGGSHTIPLSITWSNLDITGLSNLYFSGLFAADGDFENGLTGDYIRVQYRINSDVGTWTDLLWFSGTDISGTDPLALDGDMDGTGTDGVGTTLTTTAQFFSASIGDTGTTLDLRIQMSSNDLVEAFAFDSITVAVPEPSAFLFGGLVCGVIGLGAAWRRLAGKAAVPKAAA
jgi:hypothetical protein